MTRGLFPAWASGFCACSAFAQSLRGEWLWVASLVLFAGLLVGIALNQSRGDA